MSTWEEDRDEGARLLVHYFRMMHERDGRGHWDRDYEVEIREAVDYIVDAAVKRASGSPAPLKAPPSVPSDGTTSGTELGAEGLTGPSASGAGETLLPRGWAELIRGEIARARAEGFEASAASPPGNPWARAYARDMAMVLDRLEGKP